MSTSSGSSSSSESDNTTGETPSANAAEIDNVQDEANSESKSACEWRQDLADGSTRDNGVESGMLDVDDKSHAQPSNSMMIPIGVREVRETLHDHLKRHTPSQDSSWCARCFYVWNRKVLESKCVWTDDMTGEKFSWLIESPEVADVEWGLGCFLCRSAGFKRQFGTCGVRSFAMM